MSYDFKTLGHPDFEELSIALLNAELGLSLRGYVAGPDGGVDGRHSSANGGEVVLQAKHYAGSAFSSLKTALAKEKPAIHKLSPQTYLITTSYPLTPRREGEVFELMSPYIANPSDIYGAQRLNALLKKHPKVERAHVKLWLSSAAVLDQYVNVAAHSYNAMTREEIERKVRLFAPNPSLPEAQKLLEDRHVLIVAGPPGIGKTTLSEMLALAYVKEGWSLRGVGTIEDAIAAVGSPEPTVILFDDFLGDVGLDMATLSDTSKRMETLIRKVGLTNDVRFIMTTRSYILEEAQTKSDKLSAKSVDLSKYVLDIGKYTRNIRARILYNHLLCSSLSSAFIKSLVTAEIIPEIIDHVNYIPRIIEWMTDVDHLLEITPETYPSKFLQTLNSPEDLWRNAFESHIPDAARHLLMVLYFFGRDGADVKELKLGFTRFHARHCARTNISFRGNDFERALKVLEGSFISISEGMVRVINPSINDFVQNRVEDEETLRLMASCSPSPSFAQRVWTRFNRTMVLDTDMLARFAESMAHLNEMVFTHRTSKEIPGKTRAWQDVDIPLSDRFSFLIELQLASPNADREEALLKLSALESYTFSVWRDLYSFPNLINELREHHATHNARYLPKAGEMADNFEKTLIEVLESHVLWPEQTLEIYERVSSAYGVISDVLINAATDALSKILEDFSDTLGFVSNESDLDALAETLPKIGNILARDVSYELGQIKEKLDEFDDSSSRHEPDFRSAHDTRWEDYLSDEELSSMFSTLLDR